MQAFIVDIPVCPVRDSQKDDFCRQNLQGEPTIHTPDLSWTFATWQGLESVKKFESKENVSVKYLAKITARFKSKSRRSQNEDYHSHVRRTPFRREQMVYFRRYCRQCDRRRWEPLNSCQGIRRMWPM